MLAILFNSHIIYNQRPFKIGDCISVRVHFCVNDLGNNTNEAIHQRKSTCNISYLN